jgi:poly-gamma-glutamate capsule biosynthesis protein CapA/YwtB (metallophosphatase superfamily)
MRGRAGGRAGCALVALALTAAACSGGAPGEAAPSPSTERTTAAASPAPEPRTRTATAPPGTVSPTTDTDTDTARGTQDRPDRTRVTVVGDIMLGRGVAAASAGDPSAPLRPMQRRLRGADITVGNLESTLSRAGAPRQGDDSFASPPAVVGGLAGAGFDVLSLANNHTGDFGETALRRTLRRLEQSPIRRVGAGRDLAGAWRPVVVRRNGVRFGFVAFNAIGETPRATAGSPGAAEVRMPPRTGPLSPADLRRARREVRSLARNRADVVVALPHWGEQYTHVPVTAQRRVGRAMLRAGADIVVGGHPHWVQRVQRVRGPRGGLVVHSLGNFVFDMDFMRQTMQGVLADLVFVGDTLRRVRFTPYVLGPDFAPRVVRGARAREIIEPLGVPRVVRLSRRAAEPLSR